MSEISEINLPSGSYDIKDGKARSIVAPEFSSSSSYGVGDYVIYKGALYKCTTAHSAGAWNANHFESTNVADNLNGGGIPSSYYKTIFIGSHAQWEALSSTEKVKYEIINYNDDSDGDSIGSLNGRALSDAIAEEFDATKSYAVDDFVMYLDDLFKCTTAHSGAWSSNDFTKTDVVSNFGSSGGGGNPAINVGISQYKTSGVTTLNGNMTVKDNLVNILFSWEGQIVDNSAIITLPQNYRPSSDIYGFACSSLEDGVKICPCILANTGSLYISVSPESDLEFTGGFIGVNYAV